MIVEKLRDRLKILEGEETKLRDRILAIERNQTQKVKIERHIWGNIELS